MELEYKILSCASDPDIPCLISVYERPEISRYISIDKRNFFSYVSNSPNVAFYKVYADGVLAAALHLETDAAALSMSILVFPQHQRRGLGTQILRDVQRGIFPLSFEGIAVSIDETNTASRKLFEKAGFVLQGKEDELLNFCWKK